MVEDTLAPKDKSLQSNAAAFESPTIAHTRHFVYCCFAASVLLELIGVHKFAPINMLSLKDDFAILEHVIW